MDSPPSFTPYLLLLLGSFLFGPAQALQVDCFIDRESKISCNCFGFDRDTIGQEDLGDIVQRFVADFFVNVNIRHVEILDCGNLDINVNLRAFVVDGIAQNISIVSFENVDDLKLNIQNVDYGDKQFVFKSVRFLELSGDLMHPSTRVSIFVLNDRFVQGDVAFKDFVSQSDIQLINIQDARSVRVSDSAFAQVREVDILRTDGCYADGRAVECEDIDQLFPSSWFSAWILRNPVFLVLLVLVLLLILLSIFACIYVRHWKRKKEIEMLGYPASTISQSTPPPGMPIGPGGAVLAPQQQQMQPMTTPGGTMLPPGTRLSTSRPNLEADPAMLAKERELLRELQEERVGATRSRMTKERY